MTEMNLLKPIIEPEPITDVDQVTPENILDPAVFDFIFDIKDERVREVTVNQLAEIARQARKKTDFDKKLKAYAKKRSAEERQNAAAETAFFTDAEIEAGNHEYHCGDWTANQGGIYRIIPNGYNDVENFACYAPVYINRFYRNIQTNCEKVDLRFKRDGHWQAITPTKSMVTTANKIVTLSDMGLPVTSESAKYLVQFLYDIERLNHIPIMKSTEKLGWMKDENGDLFFVPYDTGEKIVFDAADRFDKVYHSIHEGGNYQTWLDLVKGIRKEGRPEPRIIMAASVASVLVKFLGTLPFVVHIYGQTGRGKGVSLQLGASIWAKPDDYISGFNATKTSIEALSDMLNNFPFFLDDTAEISKRYRSDFTSQLIYMLCNGEGKSRSNVNLGIRRPMSWQNVSITSGEHPLTDATSQGGAINRVVNVDCGNTDIYKNGREVSQIVNQNFGYAGKFLIPYITSHMDDIQDDYNIFYDDLADKTLGKQAQAAALLLTADKVLEAAIFHDGILLDVDEMAARLRTESDVSESERCYHMLVDDIKVHRNNFIGGNGDNEPHGEIWGQIVDDDASEFKRAIIPKTKLEDLVRERNFSVEEFTKWASRKELFDHRADGRTSRRTINGKRQSCYNMVLVDDIDDYIP